jgi:2-dehydropantoate 2-reductase
MRVLVIGAGAVGAYFGARLLEAGGDATFLVRPKREAQLRQGLSVRSPKGDVRLASVQTISADRLKKGYDLILLSCKAYDLPGAVDDFAPAVDPNSAILPLLNGMRHLDVLKQRFGAERCLGGQCQIAATLGEDGSVMHLNETHQLSYGELTGSRSARVEAIEALFSKARFDSRLSEAIVQEMWEKWVFIAALAGSTCLMRGAVGDIVRSGGVDLLRRILAECAAIASAQGFAPRPQALGRAEAVLSDPDSTLTASMLRDLERGARTEAEHIIGDLVSRRQPAFAPGALRAPGVSAGGPATAAAAAHPELLDVAYAHLKTYEFRRGAGR